MDSSLSSWCLQYLLTLCQSCWFKSVVIFEYYGSVQDCSALQSLLCEQMLTFLLWSYLSVSPFFPTVQSESTDQQLQCFIQHVSKIFLLPHHIICIFLATAPLFWAWTTQLLLNFAICHALLWTECSFDVLPSKADTLLNGIYLKWIPSTVITSSKLRPFLCGIEWFDPPMDHITHCGGHACS